MAATPRPRDQFGALVHSFLARFFENEITSGTDDLKSSFFWLLAFLMAPGLFMPFLMSFSWDLTALFHGPDVLQVVTRGDKAFYIGFAMVASALIGAIAWSSLLVDRRDGLILGALPVRASIVVQAKLAALGAYILLIAIGMHTVAAVAFGTLLSNHAPFAFMLRSIAAHFIVPCAASAFTVLSIAAVQGVALALTGPRVFAKLSPFLQIGLVGTIVLGLLILPVLDVSVVSTLRGTGTNVRPWLLHTPPLWFLGAYEWILGADDPVLAALASKAVFAVLAAAALTVGSYPVAYRRLMTSVVEAGADVGRTGMLAGVAERLTRAVARRPQPRAVSQFFLSSAFRVDRLRFVIATSLGVAVAWSLPTGLTLLHDRFDQPSRAMLSLPIAATIFVLAGLRGAAALPADVKAAWLFELHAPSRRQTHAALERTMFAAGVLPVVALSAPAYWWLWGGRVAATHSLVSLAAGVLMIELLLWRFEGMPCARLWDADRLKLGKRWWLYVAVFAIFTVTIPHLELLLVRSALGVPLLIGHIAAAALLVRFLSRRQPARAVDDVDAVSGGVLNLE